ncbi:hypothetical protein OF83DRAFT_1087747 [Amylostereum chailletii]|nr:hypothetical protein OF83DRAFT_1087747 [Amylostereum chailletii]
MDVSLLRTRESPGNTVYLPRFRHTVRSPHSSQYRTPLISANVPPEAHASASPRILCDETQEGNLRVAPELDDRAERGQGKMLNGTGRLREVRRMKLILFFDFSSMYPWRVPIRKQPEIQETKVRIRSAHKRAWLTIGHPRDRLQKRRITWLQAAGESTDFVYDTEQCLARDDVGGGAVVGAIVQLTKMKGDRGGDPRRFRERLTRGGKREKANERVPERFRFPQKNEAIH